MARNDVPCFLDFLDGEGNTPFKSTKRVCGVQNKETKSTSTEHMRSLPGGRGGGAGLRALRAPGGRPIRWDLRGERSFDGSWICFSSRQKPLRFAEMKNPFFCFFSLVGLKGNPPLLK